MKENFKMFTPEEEIEQLDKQIDQVFKALELIKSADVGYYGLGPNVIPDLEKTLEELRIEREKFRNKLLYEESKNKSLNEPIEKQ